MEWRRRLRGMRPGGRTLKWAALALAVLVVLPPVAAGATLRAFYAGDPVAGTHTRGRDAIWLGHAWVDGRKDERDLARLERRIAGTGIRDLYVHTGPLEFDGTLRPSLHPRAKWLLEAVAREMPGVRVQSWLGQLVVYDEDEPGGLPLPDAAARRAVVDSARRVLELGFDGVHLNLEPLRSGSGHYLRLLDRLRRVVHRHDGVLSVASHQIEPAPGMPALAGAVTADGRTKWWSRDYFADVARRVDQIAVMSYDTWMPLESLYGGYVAQQTELALENAPEDVEVLMGLPFYHTDTLGREPQAETVPAAIRGVRLGLSRADPGRERFGVALYVDFAARDADWRAYRSDWCTTRSARGMRRGRPYAVGWAGHGTRTAAGPERSAPGRG